MRASKKRQFFVALVGISLLTLVFLAFSCGGDGGGGGAPGNQAPVADAGQDQTVDEGTLVTLDGSNSYDPEGATLIYLWTQLTGSTITLSDPTAEMPTFTAPQTGPSGESFEFELTVEDDVGGTGTDKVIITVSNVNQPPNANAGPDQLVNGGDLVTLDGTGSDDPDGSISTFEWTQTAGTSVTLSNVNDSQPTFTAPTVFGSAETLTFELRVTDDLGLFATDTVDIVVNPTPRFADDFSTDSRSNYWTQDTSGAGGQFNYDATGERLAIVTGNDIGFYFSPNAPTGIDTNTGTFSVDFIGTVTYPSAGGIIIRLVQDANNYYEFSAFDEDIPGTRLTPGGLRKFVGGVKVDEQLFTPVEFNYDQGMDYTIMIDFSPSQTTVTAFGETLTINTNTDTIQVNSFQIDTRQQDAFYDNIALF